MSASSSMPGNGRKQEPHTIEKILSLAPVRAFLRSVTARDNGGPCRLEEVFHSYGHTGLPWAKRIKYALPFTLIDVMCRLASARKESVIEHFFQYRPRARALLNTARSIGSYGLTRPQIFSAPLMVVWNFTQACNLKCQHCYQGAGKALTNELDLEEKLQIVDQLIHEDVVILALSGGEPVFSPDLTAVTRKAHGAGMYVTLATNGTLISPEKAVELSENGVDYVEISLDSVHPEKHNAFRGIDCWERALHGVRNCLATGKLRVGLASTLTSMNVAELDDLIEFAKDLGVHAFTAFNFIPTGRGRQIKDTDMTPQQREKALQVLWKHLQEDKIEIMCTAPQLARACLTSSPLAGSFAVGHAGRGVGEGARVVARYVGGCGAGRCYVAIQPDGVVTPCVYLPQPIGNLREQSLAHIWNHSEVCKNLRNRDLLESNCGTCPYRDYCGGCRARAYGYFHSFTAPDPGCIRNLDQWTAIQSGADRTWGAREDGQPRKGHRPLGKGLIRRKKSSTQRQAAGLLPKETGLIC